LFVSALLDEKQFFSYSQKKMNKKQITLFSCIFAFSIILIDQIIKILIKTNFELYSGFEIFSWFQIYFIENKGMAFGMELGSKIFLTIFRIVACGALIFYIYTLIKRNFKLSYILTITAILAGAIGNLIDSIFYGKIFSHSFGQVAELFPQNGGYGNWLEGKVVDMFYFPLIKNDVGEVLFFQPVFNFADIAVTVGVFVVILFFRQSLDLSFEGKKESDKQ
jgi:signal peptidase II